MQNRSITFPVYRRLLTWSTNGWIQRQLAYFSAGWLSLVGIKPALGGKKAASLRTVLLSYVFVALGLLLLAQTANLSQSALQRVGGMTLENTVLAVALVINLWRYGVGRSLMKNFAEAQGDTEATK